MRVPFQYASATGFVSLVETNTGLVNSIYSRQRHLGHGTGLMEQIIFWADAEGVTLHLTAQAYGNGMLLDNPGLVEFYRRFGFERRGDCQPWPARMIREPREKYMPLNEKETLRRR